MTAKGTERLTDTTCRNAAPRETRYKLADGGGLNLWIEPNGAKYWRLKYRFGGKERLLALGGYIRPLPSKRPVTPLHPSDFMKRWRVLALMADAFAEIFAMITVSDR